MKYLILFLLISHNVMAEFNSELSQIIDYEINQIGENLVESRILDPDETTLTSFSILSDLSVGVALPFVVNLNVMPVLFLRWTRPTN
jgi:hypothetical protein